MPYTPGQLLSIGMLVLFGGMLQGAVGFGFGLFAVPLLVWIDMPLPSAIVLTMTVTFFQTVYHCHTYRRLLRWRPTVPILVLRVITLPIGIALLALLTQAGTTRVKQVVGAALLLVVVAQWALRVRPQQYVHPGWTVLAGTISGIMAGMLGMGGPALMLWVMAHRWSGKRARLFMWLTFVQITPFNIAMLYYRFGDVIWDGVLIGVATTPIGLVGAKIGIVLGDGLSRQRLRNVVYIMLILIAIASIAAPLLAPPPSEISP